MILPRLSQTCTPRPLALVRDCSRINFMSPTSRRTLSALLLLALAVMGLHLLTPRLSEAGAWGVWPFTYLPVAWRWGTALVAALSVILGAQLWDRVGPYMDRLFGPIAWGTPGVRSALAVAAALPFWLFRIRHLRWGDAYLLVASIPHPDVKLTYVWQAPLDVFIHARLWQLAQRWLGWPDPIPVYWIVSTLAGVAFVWITLGLAAWLGRNRAERMLLAGLVLTLGTMQLFFGYIENYSLMTVGVLLYAWLALAALRGKTALIWPAAALALTHAFHPSTIILAPSLLYLAGLLIDRRPAQRHRGQALTPAADRTPRKGGISWQQAVLSIAVPYVLVFAGVVALLTAGHHGLDALLGADFPGGGDRQWFVPLFEVTTRWQHYTMFSWAHLLDIANQQLMSAPLIWPSLILVALLAWRTLPRDDQTFRLLAFMALSYLLLTLTWNPDYGGQRDWDLFSPAAVPATLLLAYVLPRALPERRALCWAGWALVVAQALHTGAWIYQNTRPYAL